VWALARTKDADPVERAQGLTEKTGASALGGWVYDSDFAFLGGVGPDGRAFELLVGEPYEADGYFDRLAAPSSSEPGGRWVDSLACGASPATLSGARKRTRP
jgi:hypothetical protein